MPPEGGKLLVRDQLAGRVAFAADPTLQRAVREPHPAARGCFTLGALDLVDQLGGLFDLDGDFLDCGGSPCRAADGTVVDGGLDP